MAYTKTTWVNNDAPYLNDTNLNKMEDGIFNNDAAAATKINTANGSWTGTLTGQDLTYTGTITGQDITLYDSVTGLDIKLDGNIIKFNELYSMGVYFENQFLITNTTNGNPLFQLYQDSGKLAVSSSGIYFNNVSIPTAEDYATDIKGGVIKIKVIGTDAYITTDGSTPGA